jgi:hypothetical protein
MKRRSTSESPSATPVGIAFSVQYMPGEVKRRPPMRKKGLVPTEPCYSPWCLSDRIIDLQLAAVVLSMWYRKNAQASGETR